MAYRFALYEALISLERGNYLVRLDDISFLYYLEGCRDVCHVTDILIENGWIEPIDDKATYFTITELGRAVVREGRARYRLFPFWKKVLGRTHLFSFRWPDRGHRPTNLF